jgi:mRNA interferase MazF
MKRGEIYWGDLPPPYGRRPLLVVTRSGVVPMLTRVTVAPITSTMRGIASEVLLGRGQGLPFRSAASCDNLQTVEKSLLDASPVGHLPITKVHELDQALRFALEIRY